MSKKTQQNKGNRLERKAAKQQLTGSYYKQISNTVGKTTYLNLKVDKPATVPVTETLHSAILKVLVDSHLSILTGRAA